MSRRVELTLLTLQVKSISTMDDKKKTWPLNWRHSVPVSSRKRRSGSSEAPGQMDNVENRVRLYSNWKSRRKCTQLSVNCENNPQIMCFPPFSLQWQAQVQAMHIKSKQLNKCVMLVLAITAWLLIKSLRMPCKRLHFALSTRRRKP